MTLPRRILSLIALGCLSLLACGGDDDDSAAAGASGSSGSSGASGSAGSGAAGAGGTGANAGSSGSAGVSGSAGNAGSAGDAGSAGAGGDGPCTGVYVRHVTGKVVSLDGADLTAKPFTVCGNVCLTGHLSADGSFDYTTDRCFESVGSLPRPVFIYHGESVRTDLYFDFVGPDVTTLDTGVVPTLYAVPVESMTQLSVTASGPQKLDDGAGFELSFDAASATLSIDTNVVAVKALAAENRPALAGMDKVEALWATYPSDVSFDPPAQLRLPNTANLAPGTQVDIVAIGTSIGFDPYPGSLAKVDDGVVSPDGSYISTTVGVSTLAWFGYQQK